MTPRTLFLKPGRDKSARLRHPWIFASAIERDEGSPESGDTVEIRSSQGESLGWAAFSPHSQIRARFWSFDPHETVGEDFFRRRLQSAFSLRDDLVPTPPSGAVRLVHAESDGLPGVVLDRYGDVLVLQLLTAGAEIWRETLASLACQFSGLSILYERSDVDVRSLEGLPERSGSLRGPAPASPIPIEENGLKYRVDILHGHKTGFYLDQRLNRKRLGDLVRGCNLLNCFCYTGGFTLNGLAGGATRVVSVDSSAEALALASQNATLNGFSPEQTVWMEGDVFQVLRTMRDRGEKFDAIVLDPPKFAPTVSQAEKAARGYKDINLLAFKLLNPGGLLFTFSCSGGISADFFQKIVFDASLDAGVNACILEHLFQGPDHPVALNFPEGSYLKGLICRVS